MYSYRYNRPDNYTYWVPNNLTRILSLFLSPIRYICPRDTMYTTPHCTARTMFALDIKCIRVYIPNQSTN